MTDRVVLQVRLKPEEKAKIKEAADLFGVSLSEFVRDAAMGIASAKEANKIVRDVEQEIAAKRSAHKGPVVIAGVKSPRGQGQGAAATPSVPGPTLFRCKWSDCDYGAMSRTAVCKIHGCRVVAR